MIKGLKISLLVLMGSVLILNLNLSFVFAGKTGKTTRITVKPVVEPGVGTCDATIADILKDPKYPYGPNGPAIKANCHYLAGLAGSGVSLSLAPKCIAVTTFCSDPTNSSSSTTSSSSSTTTKSSSTTSSTPSTSPSKFKF